MRKRFVLYSILGVLALALCALCLFISGRPVTPPEPMPPQASSSQAAPPVQAEEESASKTEVPPPEPPPYESPIDFRMLTADTPDIRAWLSIPGLEIEAPVVGHETDNTYYHRRDIYGNYSLSGSFYLENYNAFDFSDPVTVIYGHNMKSGMFGQMQERYSNAEFFNENNSFTIYTPDAQYDYRIIAAVPYSNRHILYYHDFYSFAVMEKFLREIFSTRSLLAVTASDTEIVEGDRLCILSTCLDGDNKQRYLVIGAWSA